jgi:hypothetical protein
MADDYDDDGPLELQDDLTAWAAWAAGTAMCCAPARWRAAAEGAAAAAVAAVFRFFDDFVRVGGKVRAARSRLFPVPASV